MDISKFGFDDVRKRIQSAAGISPGDDEVIFRRLTFIARECCNHARLNGAYKDRTRALRSSIGFRIYHNGELLTASDGLGGQSPVGIEAAKAALDKFPEDVGVSPIGWTVIMVAGMSYATYVEAKGYNVLHLTEVELKNKIEALRKELNF